MGRPREFDVDKALDRAMGVFWQKGYEGASLQDLLHAMEIARGSLYKAFEDKHSIYLAPLLTMLICIALGMGVPCVPAYVVTSVITLPIMTKLGFTGLGPHLFILYYAVIASVTPPVARTANSLGRDDAKSASVESAHTNAPGWLALARRPAAKAWLPAELP